MSFIITVYTNEGIIMASDSRTTYTTTTKQPDGVIKERIGVQTTDSTYKTFLCPNNVGISTCGTASISNVPIAGFIEKFIIDKVSIDCTVQEVAHGLLDYFSQYTPIPDTHFMVAGYNEQKQREVYTVYVASGTVELQDTLSPGIIWDGESDVFKRLVKTVAIKNNDGTYTNIPSYSTGYNFFTLQDAIDYAEYAVDVTIKTMFFQDRVKTVGGAIDILAIKPNGSFWIKRKELHA